MSEQESTKNVQDEPRATTSRAEVALGLTLLERLHATKVKGVGETGRPPFERDSRDELDRDSGRMTWRVQVYDRETDYWEETVTFKDTGELKFRRVGRLSEKEAIVKAFNHYRPIVSPSPCQPPAPPMFPEEGFEGDDRISGIHSSGVASGIVARMAAFRNVTAGARLLSVHRTC